MKWYCNSTVPSLRYLTFSFFSSNFSKLFRFYESNVFIRPLQAKL